MVDLVATLKQLRLYGMAEEGGSVCFTHGGHERCLHHLQLAFMLAAVMLYRSRACKTVREAL